MKNILLIIITFYSITMYSMSFNIELEKNWIIQNDTIPDSLLNVQLDSLKLVSESLGNCEKLNYFVSRFQNKLKGILENEGPAIIEMILIHENWEYDPNVILSCLKTNNYSLAKKIDLLYNMRIYKDTSSFSPITKTVILNGLINNVTNLELLPSNIPLIEEYISCISVFDQYSAMKVLNNLYDNTSVDSLTSNLLIQMIVYRINTGDSSMINLFDSTLIAKNIDLDSINQISPFYGNRLGWISGVYKVDTSNRNNYTNTSDEDSLTIFDLYPNHPELIVFLDTTLDLHGVLHHGDDGRQFGDYTTSELLQILDSINITTAYPSDQLMGYIKASIYIRKITQIIGDRLVNNELILNGQDQIILDRAMDDLMNVVQNSWTVDTVFTPTDTITFHNPNSVSLEAQEQLLRLWTIPKERYIALLESDDEILRQMAQRHLSFIADEALITELIQYALDSPNRRLKYRVIKVLKRIKHVAHPQGAVGNKPFRRPMYSHAQAQDWKERLIDPGIIQIKAR